jgi:geranylgeranyl diphosphate synthase type II
MSRTVAKAQALSPSLAKDPLEERLQLVLPPEGAPPQLLHRAMRHAVFPSGKRIRPRLLLTVAAACAADEAEMELAMTAACAVELVHSASLVHDDLPCFDDAALRRGRETVHKAHGEALAVLAGDALLALAFEVLADTPPRLARRALRIVRLLGMATGSREGIIGGQSLEQNLAPVAAPSGLSGKSAVAAELLDRYHAMKTAALFRLATEAGATAAGATDASAWAEVGEILGLAFQLADDLCDVVGKPSIAGKPVRKDAALGRPNAAVLVGEEYTRSRLAALIEQALRRTQELAAEPKPLVALIEELYAYFLRTTH